MTLLGVPMNREWIDLDKLKAALREAGVISASTNWTEVESVEITATMVRVHCVRADPDQPDQIRWSYSIGYAPEKPRKAALKAVPAEKSEA